MSKHINFIKYPHVLISSTREVLEVEYKEGMSVYDVIKDTIDEWSQEGYDKFYVSLQGQLVTADQYETTIVNPDDYVGISIEHGFQAIQGLVWVALWQAGMYTAINAVSFIIAAAITIGAGMLINSIMAPAKPETPGNESPSYASQGARNGTAAGAPVPVVYGDVISTPQLIGGYRTVDTDYSMWQHVLLAVCAGETNNKIEERDVFVGDEELTAFTDYTFGSTSGSVQITDDTRTALETFDKVHKDRIFDRVLQYDPHASLTMLQLLHGNLPSAWQTGTSYGIGPPADFVIPTVMGTKVYECTTAGVSDALEPTWPLVDGTTVNDGTAVWTCRSLTKSPIYDSSLRGSHWTNQGNTQIVTSGGKFGDSYISFPAANDYASTDDLEVFRMGNVSCTIEGFIKVANQDDRVFFMQEALNGKSCTRTVFGYRTGKLILQSYYTDSYNTATDETVGWYATLSMEKEMALSTGAWRYFRIQRYGGSNYQWSTQVLLEDGSGVLQEVIVDVSGYISNQDQWLGNNIMDYDDILAGSTKAETYTNWLGKGYIADTVTYLVTGENPISGTIQTTVDAITEFSGKCDFDEIRVTRGTVYETTDRVIPTVEFTDPVPGETNRYSVSTKSKCDSVRLIIEFMQGLGGMDDKGGTESCTILFKIGYRKTGTEDWTDAWHAVTGERLTTAVRDQYEIVFPRRDYYDISILRLTENDDNDAKRRSQSTLTSVEEIIDIRQCYPGMQVIALGIKMSDKINGQLSTIRVRQSRTSILVPRWNGDGSEFVDPTIPAYQFTDALTNPHYGMRTEVSYIDEDAFDEWKDWTEGLIDSERRAVCNVIYDEPGNFQDNLMSGVEQAGRARLVRTGSLRSVAVDKPRNSQYLFSSGNIVKNSFEWQSYESTELTDAVEIKYWDISKNYAQKSYLAKASWYETLDRMPKVSQVEVRGINNKEQAVREAKFRINKNEYLTRHGKHKAELAAALIEFGDVFDLLPPTSIQVFGGRLVEDHTSTRKIYIDQKITLDRATFSGKLVFYALGSNGTEFSSNVTGPYDVETRYILIEDEFTGSRWDTFGLAKPTENKLKQQLIKKTLDPETSIVDLEWCEYDSRVFYHPDHGEGVVEI